VALTPREVWREGLCPDPWTTFRPGPIGRPTGGGHRPALGRAGGATGSGHRARGPAEPCRPGLGLGAGKARWDIFLGDVAVLGSGVDRGLHQCYGCQRVPLRYPIGVG
jgi:hypothetical protein